MGNGHQNLHAMILLVGDYNIDIVLHIRQLQITKNVRWILICCRTHWPCDCNAADCSLSGSSGRRRNLGPMGAGDAEEAAEGAG